MRLWTFQTGGMGCETVFVSDGAADAAVFECIFVTVSIMCNRKKVSIGVNIMCTEISLYR